MIAGKHHGPLEVNDDKCKVKPVDSSPHSPSQKEK